MRKKKILVVDDEFAVREIFEVAFSSEGYTVVKAWDAEHALGQLKREKPEVIFIDLNLPGMNGVELCKKIRETNSDSYIYAMTGYSKNFKPRDCFAAGFDNYFLKPVKLTEVLKIVQGVFNEEEESTEV